jgi:hypothetical protein
MKNKIIIIFITIALFNSCSSPSGSYGTGLLGPGETSILETVQDETLKDHINDMIDNGWMELVLPSSDMDACYEYSNEKVDLDNRLDIKVGDGTDISVRLIEIETNKCIRYVYVRKNDTYRIPNIPEGKYILKIASGFGWFGKYMDGKCYGKFLVNPMYEKGSDTLDFNVFTDYNITTDTIFSKDTVFNNDETYSIPYSVSSNQKIPSFEFSFNVINNNLEKSFHSESISEQEFNN